MNIYWLPYLNLSYPHRGPQQHQIGNAIFCEDNEEKWQEVFRIDRPGHLNIFRDFPDIGSREVGEPCFGTILYSDDEQWLVDHVDEVVAILFFFCDNSSTSISAERFTYKNYTLSTNSEGDGFVTMWNKVGRFIEGPDTISLLPPLGVRGNHPLSPNLTRSENRELLSLFETNPYDRKIVAVRQYFRTQISDTFYSPPSQDVATYCAAMEAGLGIDSRQRGVGDEFADRMCEIYGREKYFEEYFFGLYVARSLHVHGVSENHSLKEESKKSRALRLFRSVHGSVTLLRSLTRDVIHRSFREENELRDLFRTDSPVSLLRTLLQSDDHWHQLKNLLTQTKAADKFEDIADAQLADLAIWTRDFFDWQAVRNEMNDKDIFASICTCAILVGRLTDSAGEIYEQSDILGNAACVKNVERLREWSLHDPWRFDVNQLASEADRLKAVMIIMRKIAYYFRRDLN